MKIALILKQEAEKFWPDKQKQPNQSNQSHSSCLERTVNEKYAELYDELRFSNILSTNQLAFFQCKCFHSILMHSEDGTCRYPSCRFECKNTRGHFVVKIRRTALVDWKAVERKVKIMKGSYNG
jgi:hypothetical protein